MIVISPCTFASVVKVIHTKGLARQLGNVDLELKDLASGTKIAAKMKPNEAVDEVQVESQEVQVLYKDDEGIHVMSGSTFEQSVVEDSLLGEPGAAPREPNHRKASLLPPHLQSLGHPPVVLHGTRQRPPTEDEIGSDPPVAACKLVQDGAVIRLVVFEGRVVSASAPERVSVKVVKTASPIKGKTGFKQAEVRMGHSLYPCANSSSKQR